MERIKRTKGEKVLYTVVFIILALYSAFILYHFYFLLQLATIGDVWEYSDALMTDTVATWSKNFTLSHFKEAFSALEDDYGNNFWDMTFTSIWFSIGSMVISLFFESAVTYVVCKYKFRGRNLLYNMVIFRLMLPIVGSLPSAYRIYKKMKLLNSPAILVTALDAFSGANFLIMYSFYKGISWDYAEAAFIDGANHFDVYFRIMARMAMPAISVLFITGFIGRWNEYMTVSIFMPKLPTLAYGLYAFEDLIVRNGGGNWPAYYSGVLIAAIPCILLFIIFQNSIMQTVHMGGLKG